MEKNMYLKKLLIIVTFFIYASAVDAIAIERPSTDGNFWKKMPKPERVIYVLGILEGINYGHWDVWIDLVQEAKDYPPKGVSHDVMEKWAIDFSGKSLNNEITPPSMTPNQVVSGITQMYMDYRNQQIPIVSIVDVVIQSIKGSSKEEIENRLIEMRKS
jgi:hypothetical protein